MDEETKRWIVASLIVVIATVIAATGLVLYVLDSKFDSLEECMDGVIASVSKAAQSHDAVEASPNAGALPGSLADVPEDDPPADRPASPVAQPDADPSRQIK